MLKKNAERTRPPVIVSIFRVFHGALFLYAAAIIGITFFLTDTPNQMTPERLFGLTVAVPMLLGSVFFWLAATVQTLFIPGIFFCAFLALVMAGLPMMMNVFFPTHLMLFGLAAVYGISCIVLARHFFSQPILKKK